MEIMMVVMMVFMVLMIVGLLWWRWRGYNGRDSGDRWWWWRWCWWVVMNVTIWVNHGQKNDMRIFHLFQNTLFQKFAKTTRNLHHGRCTTGCVHRSKSPGIPMIPNQYPSIRFLSAIYSANHVGRILAFVREVDCNFYIVVPQAGISKFVSDV
jgi:hypothetical protein